jgi:peptidoglycan-associated lipoprotein
LAVAEVVRTVPKRPLRFRQTDRQEAAEEVKAGQEGVPQGEAEPRGPIEPAGGDLTMNQIRDTARILQLALICVSVAFIIAGCATTASFRPEIDSMRTALAEAKAAGAETLAPEEYARAEACLDILTHEATEFKPFADPHASKYVGKCRVPFQALKDKMAATRVPKMPSRLVPPPVVAPTPEAELGIYPATGTLAEALAALPPAEGPPPPEEVAPVAEAPPPLAEVAPSAEVPPGAEPAPTPGAELGVYPGMGTLAEALAALPAAREEPVEAPTPGADLGVYPGMGTLAQALTALPEAEAPAPPAEVAPTPAEVPLPVAAVKEAVVSPPVEAPKPEMVPMAPPAPAPPPPVAAAREAEKEKAPPLKDIFFDYDMALIRPDARQTLDENAQWFRANLKATIIIEGHCDERGTPEYNLGLGQRRAQATRDYLVASGVDDKRIKIISYGRERPFVIGHDESAWKWNRRSHFVLP